MQRIQIWKFPTAQSHSSPYLKLVGILWEERGGQHQNILNNLFALICIIPYFCYLEEYEVSFRMRKLSTGSHFKKWKAYYEFSFRMWKSIKWNVHYAVTKKILTLVSKFFLCDDTKFLMRAFSLFGALKFLH